MMEERYHETTQNRFYPDMSNVNKNITVEAKLINPPTHIYIYIHTYIHILVSVCSYKQEQKAAEINCGERRVERQAYSLGDQTRDLHI